MVHNNIMEYTTYCLVFVGKTEVKHPKK